MYKLSGCSDVIRFLMTHVLTGPKGEKIRVTWKKNRQGENHYSFCLPSIDSNAGHKSGLRRYLSSWEIPS